MMFYTKRIYNSISKLIRTDSILLTTGGLRDLVGLKADFSAVARYLLEGVEVFILLKDDLVGVFITSSATCALVGVSFLNGSVSMLVSGSKHALKTQGKFD